MVVLCKTSCSPDHRHHEICSCGARREGVRGLAERPGGTVKPSVSVTVTSLSSTPNYMTAGFPGGGIVIVTLPPPPEIMVFVDGAISEDISPFRLLIWFDGCWGFCRLVPLVVHY